MRIFGCHKISAIGERAAQMPSASVSFRRIEANCSSLSVMIPSSSVSSLRSFKIFQFQVSEGRQCGEERNEIIH